MGFFEHPKHMFKLMGKTIITSLRSTFSLFGPTHIVSKSRSLAQIKLVWLSLKESIISVRGRMENSVQMIAKACREMTNDDPEGRPGFFYPTLTRIMDSFSCSPLFLFIYLYIYLYIYVF